MNHLRSERGITLVELMIVVFTGGLLLVMAMGTLLNVSGTSNNFSLNLDNEVQEMQAINALQLTFSQASELKYSTLPTLNNYTNASGIGAMREYDSDLFFGSASEPVQTLAVFMRDRQNSSQTSVSTLSSILTPTAIYFQPPTPRAYGALYIALGDSALAPTKSQLFFDGLVGMRIRNVNTFTPDSISATNGDPVTSFDVELVFRRFLGDVKPDARMFCPQGTAMAACPGIGAYKDVSRVHKIVLRNNVLARSPNSPNLPTPRDLGARMYDLVHFFGLGKTGDLR